MHLDVVAAVGVEKIRMAYVQLSLTQGKYTPFPSLFLVEGSPRRNSRSSSNLSVKNRKDRGTFPFPWQASL